MICNRDCFNCPYPDCINDELDETDYVVSEALDKIAMLLQGIDVVAVKKHRAIERERYAKKKTEILERQKAYNAKFPEKRRQANQRYYEKIKTERLMDQEQEVYTHENKRGIQENIPHAEA